MSAMPNDRSTRIALQVVAGADGPCPSPKTAADAPDAPAAPASPDPSRPGMSDCYCCGLDYLEDELVRLVCHWEVGICGGCLDSLLTRSRRGGFVRAVPVLPTTDLAQSSAFWTAAGFGVEAYADDFATAERQGVELHLVERRPAGRDRGEAYLHARDIDQVHASWAAAGLPVSELRDEPWGMREFTVVDPGGNRVRVGRSI